MGFKAWGGLMLWVLASCASPPPSPPAGMSKASGVKVESTDARGAGDVALRAMLAYGQQLEGMTPMALARERGRAQGDDAQGVLRQALAWGSPRPGADPARGLLALERLLERKDAPALALHPLARLLRGEYRARLQLEEALSRQDNQRREAEQQADQRLRQLQALEAIESRLAQPAPAPSKVPGP